MYQATGLSQSILIIIPIIQMVASWHDSGYITVMENSGTSLKNRIEELEKEEIIKALKECKWVMTRAAKRLGITERMISYKINKYGLRVKEVRWNDGAAEGLENNQEQQGSHKAVIK